MVLQPSLEFQHRCHKSRRCRQQHRSAPWQPCGTWWYQSGSRSWWSAASAIVDNPSRRQGWREGWRGGVWWWYKHWKWKQKFWSRSSGRTEDWGSSWLTCLLMVGGWQIWDWDKGVEERKRDKVNKTIMTNSVHLYLN